jgi:hypothetical protein
MAKRVRNHNKRVLREKKVKCKTKINAAEEASSSARLGKPSNLAVTLLSGPEIKTFVESTATTDVVRKTNEMKDQILSEVQEWITRQQESDTTNPCLQKLESADLYWLMTSSDPTQQLRDRAISLPHFLSKIFDCPSLEVLPSVYNRDQTWLTLQWIVDGVENPFLSRECQSVPCLGTVHSSRPLPEMVPLTTLEQYQYHLATGVSTSEWLNLLRDRRQDPALALTLYPLGRDTWNQPKCLLCRLHELFVFAIDPTSSRKSTRLTEYQRSYSLQLDGLLPHLYLDHSEVNMEWVLEETNVLLPHLKIPLVGMLVKLMECTESGNICTDNWYA